ncbi:unnamed protein product, partial [Closterium sp. Naga37s-1]
MTTVGAHLLTPSHLPVHIHSLPLVLTHPPHCHGGRFRRSAASPRPAVPASGARLRAPHDPRAAAPMAPRQPRHGRNLQPLHRALPRAQRARRVSAAAAAGVSVPQHDGGVRGGRARAGERAQLGVARVGVGSGGRVGLLQPPPGDASARGLAQLLPHARSAAPMPAPGWQGSPRGTFLRPAAPQ